MTPAALTARRLGADDGNLARRALRALHRRAAPPGAVAAFLADPAKHLYVALTARGRPVALAYGYELAGVKSAARGFLLYEIDTLPAFRRRGAARAILDAMKAACRARGVSGAWVLTNASNAPAMALYRSAGGVRRNPDDVMFTWRFRVRRSRR